ncbi:MAG: tyrosine-type recombinase/integrase [bacterium]|nr:tyrosine-type recombinase/integrase [bacterium]
MLPQIDDFLLHIQTNNYSPETLYNYEKDLKVFDLFLTNEARIPFSDVKKRTIEQYKAFLVSRDRKTSTNKIGEKMLSAGSVNRNLCSLRRYLKYLIDMDHEAPVPPDVVHLIKTPKKHPRVAELNELVSLIESPMKFEKESHIALRNRVMLEVLFATGMRISELISLNRNQLDASGKIFIRGKGRKERFVYLTDRAIDWLKKYLSMRTDTIPALFIPYSGKNVNDAKPRISPNYLQMKIKQYRELLGINVPTSAHSFRHGFATYLAESGANPAAIQILLGHESLDTTTRYVHASDKYAEQTHHDFHPLKNNSKEVKK